MIERTIAATTHGRYLFDRRPGGGPRPLLVGYHGFGEQAAIQLGRLREVRGSEAFDLVSIQGLHRFYRNGGQIVAASWMTREDRGLMIADNIAYVNAVLDALAAEVGEPAAIVHLGFSQGASMAYRAAALGRRSTTAVVAVGGDVPPDLSAADLRRLPRVLIGWGVRDSFFTADKRTADERRLREAGARLSVIELDAGHAWTEAISLAARDWVGSLLQD